ncbi:MAG TPA: TIGR03564 family F420-dependent LLM class oxidoreductase [Streptosporangiaceae bacterium]|jgi:F420-dependent oxidoreductase-like protein
MRVGVSLSTFAAAPGTINVVDRAVELGAQAEGFGLDAVWFGQMASYDAVAVASAVGRAVPRIMVGPSVVPVFPRHPQMLASAAKTAQAATGGRFHLGVGLGGGDMEAAYGLPYPPRIRYLREYLTALRPLLAGRAEVYEGETVVSRPFADTAVAGAEPEIPVIVAAMGPQALKATGALADGALPFLAGPRTIAGHIVPALTEAAAAAGRPAPRVVAAIAAVVTDDVAHARAAAVERMAFYEGVPSYRRVLDLEGARRAGEIAVIGDEETVAGEVRRYLDAGATEVTLTQTDLNGEADRVRTWRLAGELARG